MVISILINGFKKLKDVHASFSKATATSSNVSLRPTNCPKPEEIQFTETQRDDLRRESDGRSFD